MATPLSPEDYERRRLFRDVLQGLEKAEQVEVARILRKHGVPMSENRSGMFFDLVKVDAEVLAELIQFTEFIAKNDQELARRSEPKA
jgi:hypothetical protein